MSTYEVKQTVFAGRFPPSLPLRVEPIAAEDVLETAGGRYWAVAQSRNDLRDPENSPSVSMWSFLLASAQTQRLNEISVYVEHGTTADAIRLLYFNDFGLTIWRQMDKPVRITGRLRRPPRGALLSFGMPFSE